MRARLDPAGPGETLRDTLVRIGPPEVAPFLLDGPGFGLRLSDGAAEVERIAADGAGPRYRLAGTAVLARAAVEYSAPLGTAVQQVTLTNEGAMPSPPLRELHAFALPLAVLLRHAPR